MKVLLGICVVLLLLSNFQQEQRLEHLEHHAHGTEHSHNSWVLQPE